MKNFSLSFFLFIVLLNVSCSNTNDENDDDMQPNPVGKKLLKISITDNYGDYEVIFVYNSSDEVIEIERSFKEFGEAFGDSYNEIFSYNNDVIISSVVYKNTSLYNTFKFSYLNNQLTESTSFYSDGTEDEKYEFKYNANGYLESLDYFVEEVHQQNVTYKHDDNANIIGVDDSTDKSVVEYDDKPVPYNIFSYSNKIIFTIYGLDAKQNLSKNNVILEDRTYNYNHSSKAIYKYETSITYDSDDYPITKTLVETNENNTQRTVRTLTFEYE